MLVVELLGKVLAEPMERNVCCRFVHQRQLANFIEAVLPAEDLEYGQHL